MRRHDEPWPPRSPSAAHEALRAALAARPGSRSLAPRWSPSAREWRAGAHDVRTGARLGAVGATEEQAVERLAALLREGEGGRA